MRHGCVRGEGFPSGSGSVVRAGGINDHGHKHLRSGNQKHRTSLIESADVLSRKYGTLMQRSPMFSTSHILKKAVSTSPSKKCFVIFSYIPTPRYRKSLYTLVISGVGQGAGCRSGVGDILHFLCFSSPFPPSFLHESVPKGTFPCQMQQETASFLSVSFGRLSGDATGGFKVSSIKVLLRFYIKPQPHTWQA